MIIIFNPETEYNAIYNLLLMSRTLTPAKKKEIAARQDFKCANKPGSNLVGIGDYKCPLWKDIEFSTRGDFDITGYEIDHVIPHCITHDDNPDNLQALCCMCHKMKTKMTPKKYWIGLSSKNLDDDNIENSHQEDNKNHSIEKDSDGKNEILTKTEKK